MASTGRFRQRRQSRVVGFILSYQRASREVSRLSSQEGCGLSSLQIFQCAIPHSQAGRQYEDHDPSGAHPWWPVGFKKP